MILTCLFLVTFGVLPVHAEPLRVFVSIAPQKYFVEKVGGNLVRVSILVPAGADPHTYEPKPKQMVDLSKTDIFFAIGVDFEKAWLTRIAATNRMMRIVRTDSGIPKIPMAAHLGEVPDEREHDREIQHRHMGTLDPHIWLSPPLVKIQVNYIMNALVGLDRKNEALYKARYFDFLEEIDTLDRDLKEMLADRKGMPFIVFHPSWGYFAEAYGLTQIAIEMEGKAPKPAQIQKLIRFARKHDVKVVFVQPQISARIVETISREIGGQVVPVDPLALNWEKNLHEVAKIFKAALK